MKRCSCGRFLEKPTKVCHSCGKTPGYRRCLAAECATENPLDAQFCGECGSDQLSEGSEIKSLSFVPPVILLGIIGVIGGILWATGLAPAAIHSAAGSLARLKQYGYAFWTLLILGSFVYLFLPEGGKKAVNALLKVWAGLFGLVWKAVLELTWLLLKR